MGAERRIHRSLHFALKVHQIDAFNFNIKKKIFPGEHSPGPLEEMSPPLIKNTTLPLLICRELIIEPSL